MQTLRQHELRLRLHLQPDRKTREVISVNMKGSTTMAQRERDTTRYSLDGNGRYAKSRLVEAVVKKWLDLHPDSTFGDLREAFPDDTQGSMGVVRECNWEKFKKYPDYSRRRFYQPIILKDKTGVRVCNQWGANANFERFLKRATELSFNIEVVP